MWQTTRYVIRGKDKQFPNGCWKLDLKTKQFIIDTDFLIFMKTSMGVELDVVADMIRDTEAENFQERLNK